MLAGKFKDKALLQLFDQLLASYAVTEGRGLPIGNLTSQYFANFYLGFFNHYAKERMKVNGYVRYMDDVLLFADTMEEIKAMLYTAKRFLEDELLLTLKEDTIGKTASGVPFLGFLLKPKGIYLSQKKKKRLKKRIKQYRSIPSASLRNWQAVLRLASPSNPCRRNTYYHCYNLL